AAPARAPAGCVRTTKIDAAPGATAKPFDVTGVRPPTLNESVRSPTRPLMASDVKVATPATVVAVEPVTVPPPVAIVAVTISPDDATRFPAASRSSTIGCVVSANPDAAPAGCVPRANWVATPAVTVSVRGSEATVPTVAVMCASPARIPVATPAGVIDAIVASEDVHATEFPDRALPDALATDAVNAIELPDAIVAVGGGAIVTVAGVRSGPWSAQPLLSARKASSSSR